MFAQYLGCDAFPSFVMGRSTSWYYTGYGHSIVGHTGDPGHHPIDVRNLYKWRSERRRHILYD